MVDRAGRRDRLLSVLSFSGKGSGVHFCRRQGGDTDARGGNGDGDRHRADPTCRTAPGSPVGAGFLSLRRFEAGGYTGDGGRLESDRIHFRSGGGCSGGSSTRTAQSGEKGSEVTARGCEVRGDRGARRWVVSKRRAEFGTDLR